MKRSVLPLAIVISLGACAALPKAEDIKKFGAATEDVGAAFSAGIGTTRTLAIASVRERAAEDYVRGGSPDFRAKPEVDLAGDIGAGPRQLLGAIAVYGKGLAIAVDTGVIANLESASANLGASVGALLGAAGGPVGSKIGKPVGNIFARVLGRAAGQEYIDNVLGIVRETHPALVEAADLLSQDISKFAIQLKIECAKFPGYRRNTLQTIQQDRRIDRLRLWETYRSSASEIDEMTRACSVLTRFPALLAKMVKAHEALLKPAPNGRAALDDFVGTIDDFAALIKAVK